MQNRLKISALTFLFINTQLSNLILVVVEALRPFIVSEGFSRTNQYIIISKLLSLLSGLFFIKEIAESYSDYMFILTQTN